MATLIGGSFAGSTGESGTSVINRQCGTGYIMACAEAEVQGTIPGFVYGCDRRHYLQFSETWPSNVDGPTTVGGRVSGHTQADFERSRLPVTSHKMPGANWAQTGAASASVNPGTYAMIVARGNEIAAWQNARRGTGKWGATFAWTFHHEPNSPSDVSANGGTLAIAATNWRAAITNITNIWVNTCGVTLWNGTSAGVTTTEGVMIGLNLISGNTSGGHQFDWDTWWAEDTWMNNNCVLAAADGYNNGVDFKTFEFIFRYFKTWTDAKRITKTGLNKPFLAGIWETSCHAEADYTNGAHSSWSALSPALAMTKENWYANRRDFIKTTWPLLHHLNDWDAGGGGEGPWHIDTNQGDWNGYVAALQDPVWAIASSPLPSNTAPGAALVLHQPFDADASSFTTTSFARAALPTLVCISTAANDPGGAVEIGTPAIANGQLGANWSLVRTVQTAAGTVRRRATVYLATTTAGTGTLTVTTAAQSQNCIIHVVQLDAAAGTVVRQSAISASITAAGAMTIAFTNTPDPTSSTFVWAVINNNSGITEGAGYTLLGVDTSASPVTSAASSFLDDDDDPADLVVTGTFARALAAIALEIGSPNSVTPASGFGYLI